MLEASIPAPRWASAAYPLPWPLSPSGFFRFVMAVSSCSASTLFVSFSDRAPSMTRWKRSCGLRRRLVASMCRTWFLSHQTIAVNSPIMRGFRRCRSIDAESAWKSVMAIEALSTRVRRNRLPSAGTGRELALTTAERSYLPDRRQARPSRQACGHPASKAVATALNQPRNNGTPSALRCASPPRETVKCSCRMRAQGRLCPPILPFRDHLFPSLSVSWSMDRRFSHLIK